MAFDLLGISPLRRGPARHGCGAVDALDPDLERRQLLPDLVLVAEGEPGLVVTVEAQSRTNGRKRWRIPHYQAALADEHQRDTWVVVVSFSPSVSRQLASWARTGRPRFEALVLDCGNVPVGYDRERARARPSAAVLGAALHACRGDIEAARWGLGIVAGLPVERRMRDATTILAAVSKSMRITLVQEFPFAPDDDRLMEIERRSGTYHLGHDEGRQAVLRDMVLAILEVRGLEPSAVERERVLAEEDLDRLQRWSVRARTVPSVAALFCDD
ncbi:hypothetical protein PPSIR1_36022 [Plesiocystis pacifica SIR-1]|uniref:Uncharacterized protein n=1 Tax=Plesiocystis pacifica SIR-1 TaxID=391625 RepID=A6G1Y3_9BACT|nr:hypothetical protein PPSIR1_36022 [Plesiocystis pacifica SIR-1]